ncbi:MAG: hypothetical protein COX65_04880 [Elusimicrobia bacterium CG_4_10_14_0_2_um_filter_56_8]|nr:MAG: hypothetical protein AUJ51_06480 [Elusimicrobia bacterium CG1_02_56_21]PJA14972.1 MAG: hypothetical protein COX65_04880 [Elusimicrobia bacterium CG_4_10_14_0_2_um_filter_56_8]
MKTATIALCFFFFSAPPLRAAPLPDLKSQDAWGEKEKKDFLGFLKSDQQIPAGQVKYISPEKGGGKGQSKARYISLALVTDTIILDTGGGRSKTETTTLGPKLLVGGHVFSWVRYYAGVKYNRVGQEKLDGTRAHLSHVEIPLGLELALIPLGTPHTRYFLLRGGVSEHYFYGSAKKADFKNPLPGWRPAWNLGLGYEWQFDNSNWRFHSLAEGYRTFSGSGTHFYGIGLTAGFVYTF